MSRGEQQTDLVLSTTPIASPTREMASAGPALAGGNNIALPSFFPVVAYVVRRISQNRDGANKQGSLRTCSSADPF